MKGVEVEGVEAPRVWPLVRVFEEVVEEEDTYSVLLVVCLS